VFKPVLNADVAAATARGSGSSSAAPAAHVPIVRRSLGSKAIKRVYRARGAAAAVADATVDVPVTRPQRERFCLADAEVLQLARYAVTIERHYSAKSGGWRPMDIEWAKDGGTGELFIVQARPETVHSVRKRRGNTVQTFELPPKARAAARVLATGRAVGAMIGAGRCVRCDAMRGDALR
jgi:pyruvate,water dikinase